MSWNCIKLINLLVMFLFWGCNSTNILDEEIEKNNINYIALGDSYTIGESVDESQRYPLLLANKLRENGYQIDTVEIIAKTGWTTDELAEEIDNKNITGPYNLVSLLIGVNNQFRGRDIDNYRIEFRSLLQRAIDIVSGKTENVFVLSIPDYGVTPFGASRDREKIAREIDQFNAVNRDETEKRGILYIDITPISRQALEDPSLIAQDGLHPSGKMYAAWVELAFPEVMRILTK